MDLVSRVQAVLVKPKEEWLKIKGEQTPVPQLFQSYVLILAAIPAVCQFIGYGLVGIRLPLYGMFRLDLVSSFARAGLAYVFSIASVYVFGYVINALAPSFQSKQSLGNAMKLAVYCMTPMWIAGVLYLIPVLGVLVLLAGLYGLYILYLGFATPLMETPKDKIMAYFVVSLVVVIVLTAVVGFILAAIVTVGPKI